jgi:Uma2 family endonuclease
MSVEISESKGVTMVNPKSATYEDLLKVPEQMLAEVIDGSLQVYPRPSAIHASASCNLSNELGLPFQRGRGGPGGWIFLYEPELHLGPDILIPDIAGWRKDRLPKVPNAPYLTLAPDWVCEVLSPSTERVDRIQKMRIYSREKVRNIWLLSPILRTLEIYRLQDSVYLRLGAFEAAEKVHAEPFDAVELDLSIIWADMED